MPSRAHGLEEVLDAFPIALFRNFWEVAVQRKFLWTKGRDLVKKFFEDERDEAKAKKAAGLGMERTAGLWYHNKRKAQDADRGHSKSM